MHEMLSSLATLTAEIVLSLEQLQKVGFKYFNTKAINEAVAQTGPLAFFLLDKGYSWEEINPHNSAMLEEALH